VVSTLSDAGIAHNYIYDFKNILTISDNMIYDFKKPIVSYNSESHIHARLLSWREKPKMPKPVGRPKSDIETEMLAVRIPVDLGEQLNRYLDRLETRIGIKANRASIARHALKVFLDAQDQEEKANTQRESQPLPLPSVQTPVQPKQPQSKIRRQILELLQNHPEGLSPVDVRKILNAKKDLGSTIKSMARDGLLRRLEIGRYSVAEGVQFL
jgi:hypothetical protein